MGCVNSRLFPVHIELAVGAQEKVGGEDDLEGNHRRGSQPQRHGEAPSQSFVMSLHALRGFAYQTAVL